MRSIVALTVVFSAAFAQAAPLGIGSTLFPSGTFAEPDPIGASVVVGGVPIPFATGTYSGTLTSTVLTGDLSNPFGPSALTFTFLLTNDPGSQNVLERLTVNQFTGWLTDASYQVPTAGLPPTLVDRLSADVVGFSFAAFGPGVLLPGQSSALLVVQTNATAFANSFASVQDGTNVSVPSYSPAPEPASIALLAVGLFAVARRRGK